MRKSAVQLYLPFIALAVVQAMLIAAFPSRPPVVQAAGVRAGDGQAGALPVDQNGNPITDAGAVAGGGPAATFTPGQAQTAAQVKAQAATFTAAGGPTNAVGDRSHCTPDGRQFASLFTAPPCVPKWPTGADNGGHTATGVTATAIKVIKFNTKANDLVNAALAPQGLAETTQQRNDMDNAAVAFLNRHYELYGRKIEFSEYEASNCETTPPTPDKCTSDVQRVISQKPFAVVFASPLYSSMFNLFAKAQIVTIGGWAFGDSYFTALRPYRYDLVMDGTQGAKIVGAYYCAKMAGKKADHSGAIIHQSIGARGTVQRHLGIITPDEPADMAVGDVLANIAAKCDGQAPYVTHYASDITKADEQAQSTAEGLIKAKVTTVAHLGDPIAPVFGTKYYDKNQYFPELLTSGMQFTDYDAVGRLYQPDQMAHAFGPSQLADPVPLSRSEAGVVWHEAGHTDDPCGSCNLNWGYASMLGTMLQMSGPTLDALHVEQGLISRRYSRGGWEASGHRPEVNLLELGPGDYTALSDFREVYWSNSAQSKIDGKPGAYVPLNGGRRYKLGADLGSDLSGIPVQDS